MQLNLAFLNPPEPPSGSAPTSPLAAAWEQLDEAARIAALSVLARPLVKTMSSRERSECQLARDERT